MPYRFEVYVARRLSEFFEEYDLPGVERIPAPGRRGPDVTWNSVKLIVDCKSQKKVPKSYIMGESKRILAGELAGVRLDDLDTLMIANGFEARKLSKVICKWYRHMDEWRFSEVPDGITCLVVRKPGRGRKLEDATLLIHKDQLGLFRQRIWKTQSYQGTQI